MTDANKNIGQLMDASGNFVAKYEYSPFGRIVSASGSYAEANPFQFSSEYFDVETGLVYYNYRYYNFELGQWLSKDPISKHGSKNLYAFVKNRNINKWDFLGFADCCKDTLCEQIAKKIQELANSTKTAREFVDKFFGSGFGGDDGYAHKTMKELSKKYEEEDKQFGPDYNPSSHGFNDAVKANGADNLKHFAGVFKYGRAAAYAEAIEDRDQQFAATARGIYNYWAGNTGESYENYARAAENAAEVNADYFAKDALDEVSRKHSENYRNDDDYDEYDDYDPNIARNAWNKTRDEVAKEWRKRFCK